MIAEVPVEGVTSPSEGDFEAQILTVFDIIFL